MTQSNPQSPPDNRSVNDLCSEIPPLLSALQSAWRPLSVFLSTNSFFRQKGVEYSSGVITPVVDRLPGIFQLLQVKVSQEQKDLTVKLQKAEASSYNVDQRNLALNRQINGVLVENRNLKEQLETEKQGLKPLREKLAESEKACQATLAEKDDVKKRLEKVEKELLAAQGSLKIWNDQFTQRVNEGVLAEKQGLEEQSKELEIERESLGRELVLAKSRVEELWEEKKLLSPKWLSDDVVAPSYEYLRRLKAATEDGVESVYKIQLKGDYVDTIFYTYEPSDVHSALLELSKLLGKRDEKQELNRILDDEVLLNLSGVLGFYNLYNYLLDVSMEKPDHPDSYFLEMLRNLAVPPTLILPLSRKLDAVPWLVQNMPPRTPSIHTHCWYTEPVNRGLYAARIRSEDVARAILACEIQNLLHFRKSLRKALSVIAPMDEEEKKKARVSPPPSRGYRFEVLSGGFEKRPNGTELHVIEVKVNHSTLLEEYITHLAFDTKGQEFIEGNQQSSNDKGK